jgi:bifunctional DNase/RNase
MSLIELRIDRIQYSETQTGAYILYLKVPVSGQRIPIIIGSIEAHSIAIGLEDDIKPQRPLTHDLMKSTMDIYQISLKKIVINKYDQGIFYAMIITEKDGVENAIDSRTSDAVAMAVRYKAPIYCESSIVDEVSLPLDIEEKIAEKEEEIAEKELEMFLQELDKKIDAAQKNDSGDDLSEIEKLSIELFDSKTNIFNKKEIEEMLNNAIEEEQYEKAAKLKKLLDLMQ